MRVQVEQYLRKPSLENLLRLRDAAAASPGYAPYDTYVPAAHSLLEQGKYRKALNYLRSMMPSWFLNPGIHKLASFAYHKLGRQEQAQSEYALARLFLEAILSTGDGSEDSPYLVLYTVDEYDLLGHLGKESGAQALVKKGGKHYDLQQCTDGSEIWFDASAPYGYLRRRLRKGKEGEHSCPSKPKGGVMHINGLDFNVQIKGEGSPFIWGHGLMSSIEAEDTLDWFDWQGFPQDKKLVRYDARGHGKSQPSYSPEDYHWPNLGKDMLAVADAIGAQRFIAGGDSMGCATTICAAVQAPERMIALVLVIPPTAWETRAAQGKLYRRFALVGGLLGGKGLARMLGNNWERMLPAWMVQEEPEKLVGMLQGSGALKGRTLWNVLRGAASTNLPPREALEALRDIPTLILAWVGDPTHPVSTAEELHGLLPKSQLLIAQGYEEFKTIPGILRDFVAEQA